jgi:Flp pilus assembly protein TadG
VRRRLRGDRGSMAVELVILFPVMLAFMMLVVAAGRLVSVKGDLEAASRDAARAASLERTAGEAQARAGEVVNASMDKDTVNCQGTSLGGSNFVAGGFVKVSLTCQVSYDGLGLIGLPGHVTVKADSSAPIDRYRRTG